MGFELPELPYEMNALTPYINQRTVEIHYGKHHRTYVDKLNALIPGTRFENAPLLDIIVLADGDILDNGTQVWNHSFYWEALTPNAGGEPTQILMELIVESFGSFNDFKKRFTEAAVTLFGSGWVWLVMTQEGELKIIQESNAGNPIRQALNPLLTCDVWEHAYYLDYQNSRPEYLEAFWKLINWEKVTERL